MLYLLALMLSFEFEYCVIMCEQLVDSDVCVAQVVTRNVNAVNTDSCADEPDPPSIE